MPKMTDLFEKSATVFRLNESLEIHSQVFDKRKIKLYKSLKESMHIQSEKSKFYGSKNRQDCEDLTKQFKNGF